MKLLAAGYFLGLVTSLAVYWHRDRISALFVSKLQQVEKRLNPPK